MDLSGDPIPATQQTLVSDISNPMGAALDPVTHDFIFTTFVGSMVVVRGFAEPLPDGDGDGVPDADDNCPTLANGDQVDFDDDGAGDACDDDDDNDGVLDVDDAFPLDPTEHTDTDGDGVGDNSDPCPLDDPNDGDGDGICSSADLCPTVSDPDQADFDGDGLGDACDDDWDGDGVADAVDLWHRLRRHHRHRRRPDPRRPQRQRGALRHLSPRPPQRQRRGHAVAAMSTTAPSTPTSIRQTSTATGRGTPAMTTTTTTA